MQIDSNGWVDVATEVDVSQNSFSRGGYRPTHIVLHGTAGGTDAEAIGRFFQSTIGGNNPASSHFIIGVDGKIVQCVSCGLAAWGNGALANPRFPFPGNVNPNLYTISIEHCKPSADNSDTITPAQEQASFELIRVLCDHYGIPKRAGDAAGGIISHADLDSVNRARCPGPYPFKILWIHLDGGANTMSGVPAGWSDDGTTLVTPNGLKVVLGFRQYILTNGWDAENWPLENEQAANPVEDYYDQGPNNLGTRQLFNRCELAWTQARGVYAVGIGNELRGSRAEVQVANRMIMDLKAQLIAAKDRQQMVTDMQQIAAIADKYK